MQTGVNGVIDEFAVHPGGSLTEIGSMPDNGVPFRVLPVNRSVSSAQVSTSVAMSCRCGSLVGTAPVIRTRTQMARRAAWVALASARRKARDLTGGRLGLLEPGELGLYAVADGEGPSLVGRPARAGELRKAAERIAQHAEHLLDRVLDERERSRWKQDHGDHERDPAADQRVGQPIRVGGGARHGDHQDGGGRGLVDEQYAASKEPASHNQRCEERDRRGDPDGDRAGTAPGSNRRAPRAAAESDEPNCR